jgi:lipoate-protein ligase A
MMPVTRVALKYLDLSLPTTVENLALDEALLIEADEGRGGPVLRIWEARELAIVLGSTCRLRDDVLVERCRADGVAITRRSSGGGTVVIGPGALNVAVILPEDAAPGLGAVDVAQRFVLDPIAAAIRERGPAVEVLGLGDLTVDLRKFAGSAQRRLRHYFLVHTSILYRFPLERIGHYTTLPRRQPAYRAQRSHDDFLVNLDLPRATLVSAVRGAWNDPSTPAPAPLELVRQLVDTKLADPVWIERL